MSGTAPGPDGFHHPASEAEIVALVRRARREGLQLRVRGAAHSVSHAIYTDAADGAAELPNRVGVQAPPAGPNLNVMLDRHNGWRVRDAARKLVEADAGIHLGRDPSDPAGAGALERSLLWQLWRERGWTLLDTGGVTHQTVSGFTATGSSGGSLQFSANRNLFGFRFVDGRGELHELTREDADPDRFHALCPHLGLLGVVTAVIFECVEAFEIAGSEATTTLADCPVDLFGAGDDAAGRPSLERWLRETPFGRLEWWPQRGVERVLTWKAARLDSRPGFEPRPYRRFGDDDPEAAQHLIGVLFAIIGNIGDLSAAKPKLEDDFDALRRTLELLGEADLGAAGRLLARALAAAIEFGVDAAITLLKPAAPLLERELPDLYPRLVDLFIPLDADRGGAGRGRPQTFEDWSWHGLPMDNAASDVLIPTEFTEAWIPLGRAREAMALLRDYFAEPTDDGAALRRAGTYAWELYAAMPERFWLNPSYSDGSDEWRDGALRIDPYWYADNAADPVDALFAGLWHLLRDAGIPFRLHWGKFHPRRPAGDRTWVDYFKAQYPRWDDFLRLRAELDPGNLFLTDYWRDRFGLWDVPRPVPREP
ncbi:D-arabinono-1,4-lactone oxidase [Conexibacter stalactiti]|uniref:D-arabinono-1,4-lactone oxidase n=1 Tax=Conexibacter stalactiti TaxID=1940611 RepID=A0ABU4HS39_9ACTN|nr:D-arabinono-1,4-lactone oxidase [Conexibacter stalactiti]MDW5596004.1 D-arabinono-1,4-lactone oxidase [Conexibacter stalactiti]MEC5036646.1 D-arabinono-1,4-lactone oxidase [Conexibacter stalactiti]